ncbi:hypothetical protein VYU27_006743, partial [Nannochloropsis oceanica]
SYTHKRWTLLKPFLKTHFEAAVAACSPSRKRGEGGGGRGGGRGGGDAPALARTGAVVLARICQLESQLYNDFFGPPSPARPEEEEEDEDATPLHTTSSSSSSSSVPRPYRSSSQEYYESGALSQLLRGLCLLLHDVLRPLVIQEVFDSYGQKCNHRFLLNYGFAVENNREADGFCPNEVPLDFALRETDPLYSRKLPCWSRDGQSKVKRLRLCVADNENMRAAFSLLRVMVANEEELVRMLGPGNMFKTARDITYPVSLRNEERVLQTLLAKLTDALSAYPTRLEDDQAALACQDDPSLRPFSNRRHALIQVRGEKEVLSAFRALCATALTLLEVSDAVFKEAVNGLYSESNFFTANYCSDILYRLRQEEQRRLGAAAAQRAERVNLSKPTIV